MSYLPLQSKQVEPVSVAESQENSNAVGVDDALFSALLLSVREFVENDTGMITTQQTFKMFLDDFAAITLFPVRPIISVESVKYYDGDGVLQTVPSSDYLFDVAGLVPRLVPAAGKCWPSVQDRINSVEIEFTAGHSDTASVPQSINHAIKLLVSHYYENRESTVQGISIAELPMGYSMLVGSFKVFRL